MEEDTKAKWNNSIVMGVEFITIQIEQNTMDNGQKTLKMVNQK